MPSEVVYKEPWVQHTYACFIGDLFAVFFIWIWPALKTLATISVGYEERSKESKNSESVENKPKKRQSIGIGTLVTYWIGASVLTAFYLLIKSPLAYFRATPFIVVVVSVILSLKNGLIVRKFANLVLMVFMKYEDQLLKIPVLFKQGEEAGKRIVTDVAADALLKNKSTE